MSNYKAIATVTAALRNLLSDVDYGLPRVFSDVKVTTKPLDKAREGVKANQLNIYLYQFLPNPTWRNMSDPALGRAGENGKPPVALDLYYLVTAYGEGDDDVKGHELIGKAMDIMHDNPRLAVDELQLAVEDNDLFKDAGLITVVPQFLPLEELSKFWTSASTGFRVSMVYKVSVVLISGERELEAGLPSYQEPQTATMPGAAWPALHGVRFPNGQDRGEIGDQVMLEGNGLSGENLRVILDPPDNADPISMAPDESSPDRVLFTLPQNVGPCGRYRVWLRMDQDGIEMETNALIFALACRIVADSVQEPQTADGKTTIQLTCEPGINPAQHAYLLVGSRFARLEEILKKTTDQPRFVLDTPEPGDYYLRLRVNGIDSRLVDFSQSPPRFNQKLKVTIA
ncbi:MAG: DUF4255 domain-containing protein [Acidobacteriota bacterium]|nr:DUF4255 domain-containing protein [Acidobacteriota bacterium]